MNPAGPNQPKGLLASMAKNWSEDRSKYSIWSRVYFN
jgi:hypothetical protein